MRKTPKRPVRRPAIRESAQQIWLAGLGAFALAQEEGGKLFHALVKKGHTVEKFSKARVEKAVDRVAQARLDARRMIGRIRMPGLGVGTALQRFGVPTRHEIVTLTKRVEELTKSVERAKAKPKKRAAAKPVHVTAA